MPSSKSDSEWSRSRSSLWLTRIRLGINAEVGINTTMPNAYRRPKHLPTLMDLLHAHRVQWHKEPRFIDLFEHISGLVVGVNYPFFPSSTANRTKAICISEICLKHPTMLST